MDYREPELTVLILDFLKERETRACLESVKKHLKIGHKIIYLHNGAGSTYPYDLFREGLIDQFIQTQTNGGTGLGTRDLFAASFSPWSFYLQNDQTLNRDFIQEEFDEIKRMVDVQLRSPEDGSVWTVKSIDLAGGMAGLHTYSERGHLIPTAFYKKLEGQGLNHYGRGPYHHLQIREGQVQDIYKANKYLHFTYNKLLVDDRGDTSVCENPDGSIWEHHADTHGVRLVKGPVKAKDTYPPFTDAEWEEILRTQSWPEWQVPARRKGI